jgi:hypothetical protein
MVFAAVSRPPVRGADVDAPSATADAARAFGEDRAGLTYKYVGDERAKARNSCGSSGAVPPGVLPTVRWDTWDSGSGTNETARSWTRSGFRLPT